MKKSIIKRKNSEIDKIKKINRSIEDINNEIKNLKIENENIKKEIKIIITDRINNAQSPNPQSPLKKY